MAGTLLSVGAPVDVVVTSALTTCTTTSPAAFQNQLPCKPGADLSIQKTASPSPVGTGGQLTYTISVNNNGPNAATDVVVQDFLPGGTTFLGCSTSQGSCGPSGNNVVANLGTLNSPGFASLTIQVLVTAPAGSSIQNTAVVSSSTPDTNTANNTVTVTTDVIALPTPTLTPTPGGSGTPTPTPTPIFADVSLTKSGSPATVVSGSTLTYQLGISNNGPSAAQGIVLRDPLPVGTTFQSCTTSQGNCLGPAVGSNGNVIANIGSLPSPGFALVTIVVTVTAPGGSTLTNTAIVNTTTTDPAIANNTASTTTTVNPAPAGADLSVVKTSSPNPVASGGLLTYTINVTNGGPDLATGVIVNDPIPSGTTFATCVPSQGTCTGPAAGTNGTVTANLGDIASGVTATITITVNVTAAAGSTLTNTAVASSATTDPNPGNNSGTTTTQVTSPPPAADLQLTKSGSPNPVLTGSSLTYTLTLNNLGPSTASTVQVSDPMPPQTTFVSCNPACTSPAVGANGTVRWDFASIPNAGSVTMTLVVHVQAPGGSTLTNTATVTSVTTDPVGSNNTATATTTVNP